LRIGMVGSGTFGSFFGTLLKRTTFNPLSATALATVGQNLDDENVRQTAEQTLAEAVAVGEKKELSVW
jgi:ketopantoate reductase